MFCHQTPNDAHGEPRDSPPPGTPLRPLPQAWRCCVSALVETPMKIWSFVAFATTLLAFSPALAGAPFGFKSNAHPADYGYCEATGLDAVLQVQIRSQTAQHLRPLLPALRRRIGPMQNLRRREECRQRQLRQTNQGRRRTSSPDKSLSSTAHTQTNTTPSCPAAPLWNEPGYWMMGVYTPRTATTRIIGRKSEGYQESGRCGAALQVAVRATSSDFRLRGSLPSSLSAISRCLERMER